MRFRVALTLCLAGLALRTHAADDDRLRLAVIIVVDQMRADYVDRFQADWTSGLKRFVNGGAWFQRAAYPYLETVTCAGHATIATGAFPHKHGVFQNAWYDRERGGNVSCTEDDHVKSVRYGGKAGASGDSAVRLMLPTFADRMREATGSRVVTLSLKARSAIMLAGRGGDAVTWLSDSLDGWESSTAYANKPVEAVRDFLTQHPMDDDRGKPWLRLLPASHYHEPDDAAGEAPPPGWTRTFPHALAATGERNDGEFRNQWERSPFGDAYLGQLAAALADSFGLGQHATTDVLAIGFSGTDLVGHAFGPDSQEIQDMMAHLDQTIGSLFERLDTLVGRGRYVAVLSADHGVAPLPQQLIEKKVDAGRLDAGAITTAIEREAAEILGRGKHVARQNSTDVYFAPGDYERLLAMPGAVDRVVGVVKRMPGVADVFRREELAKVPGESDRLRRAAALSYVPGRSGDLVIAQKPNWIFAGGGTTHGSANPDDQRVPIMLLGRGIKRGRYQQAATPADIAPTLAALAGITMPDAEGRVLREALASR